MRRQNDWYPTPRALTVALCELVTLPDKLAEPCAGDESLANVLREHGYCMSTGDIDPRWSSLDNPETDFLGDRAPELYAGRAVVTNPPFNLAPEFVKRALEICPTFAAMLLPLNWLEPCHNRAAVVSLPGKAIVFQRCKHTDFTGGGGDSKTVMWRIWDPSCAGLEVIHVSAYELAGYAGQLELA